MSTLLNIAAGAVLLAVFLGGVALFWIARQDDSRGGRILGLIAIAAVAVVLIYLSHGGHWFG